MSKKVPSKISYKIAYVISLIVGILSLLVGVLSFAVGGFIFVLFGAFFLFLYYTYKKAWKNYDSIYKQTDQKTKSVSKSSPPRTAPVSNTEPIHKVSVEQVDIPEHLLVKPDISKVVDNKEKLHVAGTRYRQGEIKSLGTENYDYSLRKKEIEEIYFENDKIYELDFIVGKVELIEEPTNEHDPNAVKVVVDDVHVGYIKKGSCSHVKKLLRENKIKKLEVDIHGGKYKYLEYDDDTETYSISRDRSDFFVDLYIYKNE